jgi:hypothetical protein
MKEEAGEARKEHVGSSGLELVGTMVVGAVFVVGIVGSLAWDTMMVGGYVVSTMMVGGGNMMGMNMRTMVVETKDAAARSSGMMMAGGAVETKDAAARSSGMMMAGGAVAGVVADPNLD